jgi:NADP-dependent 3-hydroxy acid dehydrogenase YdfG
VTGAGSGIGEAAALALARDGAAVALTGRRWQPLQAVADKITDGGGTALTVPRSRRAGCRGPHRGDDRQGTRRLDILVNNAGANVLERSWAKLTPERSRRARRQSQQRVLLFGRGARHHAAAEGRLLIHTSSWAGRFVGIVSGAGLCGGQARVVAMSYSINMEEFQHGIRSTCCARTRSRPRSSICGRSRFRPRTGAHDPARAHGGPDPLYCEAAASICINEVVISPTWNRGYAHAAGLGPKR